MTENKERNLGEQPLAMIMAELGFKPSDLVAASDEQMTHRMVTRGIKGRRLTVNVQSKILRALNRASEKEYTLRDLFNY